MHKWITLWLIMLCGGVMSALSGCASVRSNAAVCRVRFDYADAGVEGLNLQNLRALAAYKEICRQ